MPSRSFCPAGSLLFLMLVTLSSPARSDDGHWTLTAIEQDGPNTWVDIGLVLGDPIPACNKTTCPRDGRLSLSLSPCPLQLRDSNHNSQPFECTNGIANIPFFMDIPENGPRLQVLLAPGSYTITGSYSLIFRYRDHSGYCIGDSACLVARSPALATIDVSPVAVQASTWGRIKALYHQD